MVGRNRDDAYKISGQYWNPEADQYLTLQFVDEYILTVSKIDESTLIQDIQNSIGTGGLKKDFERRGPWYVVYSFRVFHKDYLPIEKTNTLGLENIVPSTVYQMLEEMGCVQQK